MGAKPELQRNIVSACMNEFRKMKLMAEGAMAQLSEAQLHERINPHQNCVVVIVQHLEGNMLSRWTDFLTTDGEKAGRDREAEFAPRRWSRAEMMAAWNRGWDALFAALSELTDNDLGRIVYIRNEAHTVFEAINRQTAHYALHLGQILLIGKHMRGAGWKYLTIPPGGSAAFNKSKGL